MNEKELNELEDNVSKGLIACGCTSGVPNICDIMDCPYKANGLSCVHNLAFDAATLLGEFQKQLHRYSDNKDTDTECENLPF